MANKLPDLGRGNKTVRVLQSCYLESAKVDDSSDFVGGMVASRTLNSNGNVVATNCGDGDVVNGIYYNHRITYFYIPVMDESITFGGASGDTQNLANANAKNGSILVTNSAGTVVYVVSTDYSINYTNGQIIRTSTGSIGATDTVLVSYRFKDPNHSGFDTTIGPNQVSLIKGIGVVGVYVYDTSKVINLNDNLKCNANGLLSTEAGLTGVVIGIVSKPPTADDPELIFDKIR